MQILAFLIAAVLVAADQWIKFWAYQVLLPVGTMPLIPNVFSLTYVENYGAAFSILQNKQLFLIIMTSIFLVVVAYLMLKKAKGNRLFLASLTLILAGGLGNLIDRVFRGFVIDYIQFLPFDFPIFNFADCCVVVGTILFMLYIVLDEIRMSREHRKLGHSENTPSKTEE